VVNQALANFVGCEKPEDVVGKEPKDFFSPERAEATLAEDRKVMASGKPLANRERRLHSSKGEKRWLMVSKVPVRDTEGKVLGVVGWNRDVTEQRRAAEDLQQSERRVQEIVDQCPAVIYLKDAEGRYLMLNQRFEELFHVTREEMLGKTDHDLFDEKTARAFQENDGIAAERGRPTQVEEKVPQDDGEHTYVSVKFPLWNMEGDVYAVGGISTDITDRKKAEEAMSELNEELVGANRDLRSAQEQLIQAEKLESVGRLAAGVAHEVKNPLAMIGMGLELLTRRLPEDDEKGQEAARRMKRGIERAKEIIKGLVDFSSAGQLGLKEYDPNVVVRETILLVEYQLKQAKVKVVSHLSEELPVVMMDKTKIEQILVNLIINAMHAMEGGGELTVRTRSETLSEVERDGGTRSKDRWREGDSLVRIVVEDTGTGIDAKKMGKIFDPFFTTKETGVGTGLGLAVSRKIAELHGGLLELENRESGGVRATLSLQAKPP
jgi:PAS domain S-box-containing protein